MGAVALVETLKVVLFAVIGILASSLLAVLIQKMRHYLARKNIQPAQAFSKGTVQ